MSNRTIHLVLLVLLLVGGGLRLLGLDRGHSDFVRSQDRARGQTMAFYTFHPDEEALIDGALGPLDLLDPPYTAYGMLPALMLRGSLNAAAVIGRWETIDTRHPRDRRRVFLVARCLAVLASILLIPLTWHLGRRLVGREAALLATTILVFAPGAIQQAHFFIVDGFVALFGLAALVAILHCRDAATSARWPPVAGLLIGAAAATRYHAALLGLVMLASIYLAQRQAGQPPRQALSLALRSPGLWLAGSIALAVVLALHPFLVVHPELMTRQVHEYDFSLVMGIAGGRLLQPWTIVDLNIIPYVSHWIGGWPPAVGWPLTFGFLAGFLWALLRGQAEARLIALWCLLYLLPIGMLGSRALRYFIPLIPLLAVVGVGGLMDLRSRHWPVWVRHTTTGAAALVLIHLMLYGLSFSQIYRTEDSRIRAGRFLANRVPDGQPIALESGAFSMQSLIDSDRHPRAWLGMSRLFYSGPYMLCGDQVDFLQDRLQAADVIALVLENRQVQFASAPHLYPVPAAFYDLLLRGDLGYRTVFDPSSSVWSPLGSIDPTFRGYDHPRVVIMKRVDADDSAARFEQWRQEVSSNPACPDAGLAEAAAMIRQGNLAPARSKLGQIHDQHPRHLLARRLVSEVEFRLGERDTPTLSAGFLPPNVADPLAYVNFPSSAPYAAPSAALAFIHLGLPDLAWKILEEQGELALSSQQTRILTREYLRLSIPLEAAGRQDLAARVLMESLDLVPTANACNGLALLLLGGNQPEAAVAMFTRSLQLDEAQAWVHSQLANLLESGEESAYHARRATELSTSAAQPQHR